MMVLVLGLSLAVTSVDAQTRSRTDSLIEQDRRRTPAQRDSVKKFLDDSIKKLNSGFVQKTAAPPRQAQSLKAPTKAPSKYKIVEAINHPGPAQKRTEVGLPVLVRSASSANELAVKLSRGCKPTDFHVTCEQFLEMAKHSPQGYRFEDIDDVIAYISTLEVRFCVPGKRATMYRVLLDRLTKKSRPIDDWNRECRTPAPGERAEGWLVDPETGDPFLSLDCGNIISAHEPGAMQIRFSDTPKPVEVPVLAAPVDTPKVAPVAVPVIRSVALTAKPLSKKLYVGQTLQATAEVVVVPDTLTKAVSWQSIDPTIATVSSTGLIQAVKPGKVSVVVMAQADMTRSATVSITVMKKKSHKGLYIGAGVVAGVACAIWCRWTTTETKVITRNGGPVNPPNIKIPDWHMAPTVYYRRIP